MDINTIEDLHARLISEYGESALNVEVSLFLDVCKVANKKGLRSAKNMYLIQLAAKIIEVIIEAERVVMKDEY